jgi:dUTPase
LGSVPESDFVVQSEKKKKKKKKNFFFRQINNKKKKIFSLIFQTLQKKMDEQKEHKAYLKGWIAGNGIVNKDGSIKLTLQKEKDFPDFIKCLIGFGFEIQFHKSMEIVLFAKDHELIKEYSRYVETTVLSSTNQLDFIRGVFDSCGYINKHEKMLKFQPSNPTLCIAIMEYLQIACLNDGTTYEHSNALDFLSKIYDGATIYLSRNHNKYYDSFAYVPFTPGLGPIICKIARTEQTAVIPSKLRASDEGYDLTLIGILKNMGTNTIMYDTGIHVEVPLGFHIEIIPRSSISKYGYMLTNSTGMIDVNYKGKLGICLTKIDLLKPDIVLPQPLGQMVLKQSIHFLVKEVPFDDLIKTERGAKGFGSRTK